jgi:DNA-binding CsgD family transcriptional regulator
VSSSLNANRQSQVALPLSLDQSFVNDFQTLAATSTIGCWSPPSWLTWPGIANRPGRPAYPWFSLTRRQQQIAALIHTGHTLVEIGLILEISVNSVHTHIRYLYAKMGVNSKKELQALMLKSELLDEYLEKYNHPG